jgi:hypothetical protein
VGRKPLLDLERRGHHPNGSLDSPRRCHLRRRFDANGAYTVPVAGTQNIGGIYFTRGAVTLSGGI